MSTIEVGAGLKNVQRHTSFIMLEVVVPSLFSVQENSMNGSFLMMPEEE